MKTLGVIGGGQLALMMGQAANEADVNLVVLSSSKDDAARASIDRVIEGLPTDERAIRELGEMVDIITFDHELVDLELLTKLEKEGLSFRPSPASLRYSVDKAFQRQRFLQSGLPVPAFVVGRRHDSPNIVAFLDSHPAVVVKAARGGYDGRGVVVPDSREEAEATITAFGEHVDVVVEERLSLLSECAQMIARGVNGETVVYPVVTSVQRDGMCEETLFPSDVENQGIITGLTQTIAESIGLVGVMAVEYFITARGILINEVALRPHNTGHWTIEGTSSSQFDNHLRTVSGEPPRPFTIQSPAAVMVNLVGGDSPNNLGAATGMANVFLHDYGKTWRPGRKMGHVTALGEDVASARMRAWKCAVAYGAKGAS